MSEIELKVGDKIKDNNPRSAHRILTITEILPNGVTAVFAARYVRLLRRRIYTDGKLRRSGFSLLRGTPQ